MVEAAVVSAEAERDARSGLGLKVACIRVMEGGERRASGRDGAGGGGGDGDGSEGERKGKGARKEPRARGGRGARYVVLMVCFTVFLPRPNTEGFDCVWKVFHCV